jgi:hypothetical protein
LVLEELKVKNFLNIDSDEERRELKDENEIIEKSLINEPKDNSKTKKRLKKEGKNFN